ncbi:hypothetical protein PUN28_015068 [Cardiocondyla obscurior]|uniref:Uncharacterized protein n=1 Tax=Cardiocondyla obscurior TaxID=286306 RepID=A0AAW2F013_9HYME
MLPPPPLPLGVDLMFSFIDCLTTVMVNPHQPAGFRSLPTSEHACGETDMTRARTGRRWRTSPGLRGRNAAARDYENATDIVVKTVTSIREVCEAVGGVKSERTEQLVVKINRNEEIAR